MADTTLYKQIVLEWGQDTDSRLWGMGYSPDNGEHFYVLNTTYGRKYRQEDGDRIWPFLNAKVKSDVGTVSKQVAEQQKVVTSAVAQANSAVAYANEAIEKSRVNQQAIVEINSAVSDAVSDAAVARSDSLRAWNAAQSNVGLIDSNYASASAAISSARTEAIAAADEAKAAASAAQADFDTKFAGMAGNINALQVDASGMKQTLVSAKGDISTLQATATGFKNTLTDVQGNISTLQSDVVGLKKTTSDHAGNIATLQADAKTLTSQMSSAQGDISTLKQTASGFSSKVSGMETSLANANSKINDVDKRIDNISTSTNIYSNSPSNWYNGTLSENQPTGVGWKSTFLTGYTNRIRPGNNGYDVTPATGTITISWADSWKIFLLEYDSNKNYIGKQANSVWHTTSPYTVKLTNNTRYIAIALAKTDDSNISPNDLIDSNKNPIVKLKVEQGSTATPFSRCAQDTDAKITTNSAAIDQNKKAIALKADEKTVNKTNETVQQLQAQLRVQADQIATKVSSSDLNAKGYATQTYTQTQIKQASDSWNANLTSIQNSLTDSYTNLHATVDGIQAQVYNKDGSSKITHLSDLIAAKVSSSDLSNLVGKGGRNLVANTNTDIVIDATSDNASDYLFVRLGFTEQPKQGDLITISAESTLTGTGTLDEYQVILYDSYTAKPRSQAQYLKAGERDSVTLSLDNLDGHGDTFLLIYAGKAGETKGKKNVVHHLMVEKGAIAHGWQPAPEDMQTYTQAQVTLLKDAINLRVAKGNVVSQINQEAGGNTLIQVSNGMGKLALNASSVIFSGSAFIPDAYITTLNADKLRFYDDSGNVATMSAGLKQYDDDKAKKTIVLQYAGGYEVHASDLLGSILTMHDNTIRLAVKAHGADTGQNDQYSGFYAMSHYAQLSCYRSNGSAPGIYITDDSFEVRGDSTGNKTKWGDLKIMSPQIYVTGGNSVSLSGSNAVQMQVNKTHTWLSDGILRLYKEGDSSSDATKLQVDGWAWINGWIEAAGHSQHSALSTKTDIQPVDDDKMLKMVNGTDLATFLYKTDVANGETHRHIGLIIDDVHDVAQYQTPQEFIAPNGVSRDDDNMIGALFGAVKALTKRIKTLESKVG